MLCALCCSRWWVAESFTVQQQGVDVFGAKDNSIEASTRPSFSPLCATHAFWAKEIREATTKLWLPCGLTRQNCRILQGYSGILSEPFLIFLKCQLHQRVRKCPTIAPSTWGHQIAMVWGQIWKIPHHKRDLAKRWFMPQMPSSNSPSGELWSEMTRSFAARLLLLPFDFLEVLSSSGNQELSKKHQSEIKEKILLNRISFVHRTGIFSFLFPKNCVIQDTANFSGTNPKCWMVWLCLLVQA